MLRCQHEHRPPPARAAKRDRPERWQSEQKQGQRHQALPQRAGRPASGAGRGLQTLPVAQIGEVEQSAESKRGGSMRDAIIAVLAVLVGVAVAAIPLLPMLFGGAE